LVTQRSELSLFYNIYWDLTRIDLPTGGSIEYTYGPGLTGQPPDVWWIQGALPGTYEGGPSYSLGYIVYRRVEERRVYKEGHVLESRQTFSKPEDVSGSNLGYVEKKQYDANNNLLFSEKHYFYGSAKASFNLDGISSSPWKDGREYHTEFYDQNGNLLRQSDQTWEQRAPVSWWTGSPDAAPQNDSRISLAWSRLENGLTSATSYTYDSTVPYNSLTDVSEYDYGACCVPGPFLRRTQTTYLKTLNGVDYTGSNITDPSAPYLRDFPLQTSVFDPWGIERARTTFEYDNYTADSNHAALIPRTSISGLDSASTTTYFTRGNVTGTTRYLLTNGSVTGSVSAYAQYDVAGNVVKAIDPLGYATMFYFTDCFGTPDGNARINAGAQELNSVGQYSYAFVTSATKAGQTAYSQYDFYTGWLVDAENQNGVVSSGYSENDPLDRLTKVIRAANQTASFKSQTLFTYDDVNRIVTTTSDFNSFTEQNPLKSQTIYDGLGRTTEARQYEGGTNYTAVQTQYDALGRAFKVSNPFRPLPPDNEIAVWTTSAFDALGRVISITTPDGSAATSSYSGNTVTATDQIGKQRKSVSDALGRITQVYEDPAGLNYLTSYSYDVLNDLVTVNQGSQTRTFAYDSLQRLLSATNPENGTAGFQYDNSGNLLVKTDARGVSSHCAYDELGRLTRRWYNGSSLLSATTNNSPALPSGVAGSDEIKYFYDSQSLPAGAPSFSRGPSVGRLVAVAYGTNSSAGDYYGYDAIGRNVLKIQQTGGVNYQVSAAYNVAGALTSETYPSGRAVAYTFDGAGRTSSVTGNLGDGTNRTYSTGIIYSSLGGMAKEQFGTTTPIYNKLFYNSRGQLSEIRESTSYTWAGDTSWNRGAIINHYSFQCWGACNGTDNNGNLKKQEVYVPENDQVTSYKTWYQQYSYDSLNRFTQVNEYTGNPSLDWQQKYIIDRYGNRTIDVNNTSANIPRPAFNVDASTNRLMVPSGQSGTMSYDRAGNLTTDSYTGSGWRTYDAESRITGAQGSGYSNSYVYDGNGKRIRRVAAGTETWQVYGLGGELLAEYQLFYLKGGGTQLVLTKEYGYRNGQMLVTAEPSANIHWLVNDQLGTPRMIFDRSGNLANVSRHDYLPFGEELVAGQGLRTAQQGYTINDNLRQHFTGYERDGESGLDYAHSRYYANVQGRFTGPDRLMGSASLAEPQSWNRYTYVLNNPLNLTDPLGLIVQETGATDPFLELAQNPHEKPTRITPKPTNLPKPKTPIPVPDEGTTYGKVTVTLGEFTAIPSSSNRGGSLGSDSSVGGGLGGGGGVNDPSVGGLSGGLGGPPTTTTRGRTFRGINFGISSFIVGGGGSIKRDMYGNWYISGGPTFGLSAPVTVSYTPTGGTYRLGREVTLENEVVDVLSGPSAGVSYTGWPPVGLTGTWNTPQIESLGLPLPSYGPPIPTGATTLSSQVGMPELTYSPQGTVKIPFLRF
jgi:RHS repeat-associated protein